MNVDDIIETTNHFRAIDYIINETYGKLIMFHECLRFGYVPFIISGDLKMFYYNVLCSWPRIKGYLMDLMDTCLAAQNNFKTLLDNFRIKYSD